jgi:uncharacterized RDD family membrane protein YckC
MNETAVTQATKASPRAEHCHRPQPGRRFVAAWAYDYLVSFWLAVWTIEILKSIFGSVMNELPLLVVTCIFMMTRDFFFEGRGLGKNLLGLRTVDARTGGNPSLTQSLVRNSVLLGPFLLYQLFLGLHKTIFAGQTVELLFAVKCLCLISGTLLLLLEGLGLHKGRGLRIADKLAGTRVVASDKPSFSNPFSLPLSIAGNERARSD